ncbi:MAG: TaqI-like C-terminal specificity domain-containing protein [Acidaminobacteraceae bacterium]
MDKIMENILEAIDEQVKENNNELKLFKVILLVFYIYHGESHSDINPKNKLYKISAKDRLVIKNEILSHNFLNQNIELYKLGLKFDKLMDTNNRVKTGSFYTPEDLAMGIVKVTISDYFKSKNEDLYKFFRQVDIPLNSELDLLTTAYNELCKLNVVDLSCGTGMFLLSFINLIIEVRINIENLRAKLGVDLTCDLGVFNVDKVYGFDIQSNPLNILKLSIVDLVMRHDFLISKNLSISCYDTLKASNSKILSNESIKCGFDIVFGNPPYIGEKSNKELFNDIKKSKFGSIYYEGKMDYFYYFIYKGISLLKEDGVLGYITTNYFVSADGALNLRMYLKSQCTFLTIVNFNDLILFPSAPGQHNMIFTLRKKIDESKNTNVVVVSRDESKRDYNVLRNIKNFGYYINENMLYDENGKITLMKDISYHDIISLIIDKSNMKIDDFISVKQGIVSGADKVSKLMLERKLSKDVIDTYNMKKDDPIFVIDSLDKIDIEDDFIKPFYKNSCIDTYFIDSYSDKYIVYINEKIDGFESKYPKAFKHLKKYKEVLSARREVQNGMKPWYLLQWGRSEDVFSKERIVVPQRSSRNKFALACKDFYGSADIYYLYINNDMGLNESDLNYYLLGILNSKLYYFWLYNMGKRKGNLLELYSKPISQIPFYLNSDGDLYKNIVELVREIFKIHELLIEVNEKNIEKDLIKIKIDKLIYEAYKIDDVKVLMIEDLFQVNVGMKT